MFDKVAFLKMFESLIPIPEKQKADPLEDTGVNCRYNDLCKGTYLFNKKTDTWQCSNNPNHYVNFHNGSIAFRVNMGATYTCYKNFHDWINNKALFPPVSEMKF